MVPHQPYGITITGLECIGASIECKFYLSSSFKDAFMSTLQHQPAIDIYLAKSIPLVSISKIDNQFLDALASNFDTATISFDIVHYQLMAAFFEHNLPSPFYSLTLTKEGLRFLSL